MHDFARDAAQWIANNKIQTIKVYDKTQKAMLEREKNIKYLSCEGNQEEVFSCKFDGSKLEILIVIIDMARDFSDNEIQVPDSFFGNNTNLRVLHLRSVCSSLPQSMQQLKNIRSLIFTRCALGDISIFGNLQSLEELDMAHCKINEMPNGITELKKFRLLKLESCSIDESNPFEVIKRCSSLQELYFVYDSRFLYGEITWPKLQRFHVSDREIDFSISKYVSIEWTDEIFLSETTLKYCMQEAEESNSNCLSMNIWESAQCVSRQSKIICNVKNIKLTDLKKIKSVFVLSITPKMLLETLTIENCDELKHIIIDTGDDDSTGGNNFGDVFPKLKKLVVDHCVQLRYIFGHYNNDPQNHTKNHLHLSSLERLRLCNLPCLVGICPKQYHTALPLLKKLVLKNCLCTANTKSINDFVPRHYVSRSVNCTTMKVFLSSYNPCIIFMP